MAKFNWNPPRSEAVTYHTGSVTDLKWNCDGTFLGSVSTDKTLKIAAVEKNGSPRVVQSIVDTLYTCIAWHPTQSNCFALGGSDENELELWDVRAQKARVKIVCPAGAMNMAWSPDGNKIVIGTYSNSVFIIDVIKEELVKESVTPHTYDVNHLVWGANSDYILMAVGKEDFGNLEVVQCLPTGELRTSVMVPSHSNNCVYMTVSTGTGTQGTASCGGRMALSSTDQTISLWNMQDMLCDASIQYDGIIRSVTFTRTSSENDSHSDSTSNSDSNSDGDDLLLAVAGENEIVNLYDPVNGKLVRQIDTKFQGKIFKMAFHPTRALLIVATDAKKDSYNHCQAMRLVNFESSLTGTSVGVGVNDGKGAVRGGGRTAAVGRGVGTFSSGGGGRGGGNREFISGTGGSGGGGNMRGGFVRQASFDRGGSGGGGGGDSRSFSSSSSSSLQGQGQALSAGAKPWAPSTNFKDLLASKTQQMQQSHIGQSHGRVAGSTGGIAKSGSGAPLPPPQLTAMTTMSAGARVGGGSGGTSASNSSFKVGSSGSSKSSSFAATGGNGGSSAREDALNQGLRSGPDDRGGGRGWAGGGGAGPAKRKRN